MKTTEDQIEAMANSMQDGIDAVLKSHLSDGMSKSDRVVYLEAAMAAAANVLLLNTAQTTGKTPGTAELAHDFVDQLWRKNWRTIAGWAEHPAADNYDPEQTATDAVPPFAVPCGDDVAAALDSLGFDPAELADGGVNTFAILIHNLRTVMNMTMFAPLEPPVDSVEWARLYTEATNALAFLLCEMFSTVKRDDVTLETAVLSVVNSQLENNADHFARVNLDARGVAGTA